MKLVVGLGNPGIKYASTRHNVGFDVIETLARRYKTRLRGLGRRALSAKIDINGEQVMLARPMLYMNLNGDAVLELFHRHNFEPSDLIIIYDDMDLPLGKIRIRPAGSAGGHNGMKSIIGRLGTSDFTRIRIGISKGGFGVDHVLSRFTKTERKIIEPSIISAADAVEKIVVSGLDAAMNIYNKNEDDNK